MSCSFWAILRVWCPKTQCPSEWISVLSPDLRLHRTVGLGMARVTSVLFPLTLTPRGCSLLGKWAPETGVCYERLRLHLPREQELDPPMSLELWAGESQTIRTPNSYGKGSQKWWCYLKSMCANHLGLLGKQPWEGEVSVLCWSHLTWMGFKRKGS